MDTFDGANIFFVHVFYLCAWFKQDSGNLAKYKDDSGS